MKKLLSLVLICAMGFGMISCVESEESQSVRDIRDAKAEQLKAYAEYYKAQAQAEIIAAEAQAAYDLAYAEYWKAFAEEKHEDAEDQKIKNEEARAKYQMSLEALKLEYEHKVLDWKKQIADKEKELLASLNNLTDAAAARISSLYTQYSNAVEALNTANKYLISQKVTLAELEAGIVSIKEAVEKDIAEDKQAIEDSLASIKKYNAQLAILTDNGYASMDKDSLYTEYLKAFSAWKDAAYKYSQNEGKALAEAREAAYEATNKIGVDLSTYNSDNTTTDIIVPIADNNNKWPDAATGDGTKDAVLKYYVDETELATKKTNSTSTDYADNLEKAEAALENAKEAEAKMKGFEEAFAGIEDAKKAIAKFVGLRDDYNNFTKVDAAAYLEGAKKDTTATANYPQPTSVVTFEPVNTLKDATAALDVLTNKDNEEYGKDGSLVKALADAKAALEEAEEELAAAKTALEAAAEADKAAKQAIVDAAKSDVTTKQTAVTNAQNALNLAIYQAEVEFEKAKANERAYADKVAEAEARVEKAEQMEKDLLAANIAATEAVETLNKLFGEDGEFVAFLNAEDEEGNAMYVHPSEENYNYETIIDDNVTLLANKNGDNDPDLDLTTPLTGRYLLADEATTYHYIQGKYDEFIAFYEKKVRENTDAVSEAEKNLVTGGEWATNWDAKEAELRAFVASLNEQIAAAQPAVDAYNKAVKAASDADDAVTELENKATALSTLASDTDLNGKIDDLNEAIDDAEEKIETIEGEIETSEKILAGWIDGNDSTGEYSDAIAWKEKKIEDCKSEIARYEAQIKYLKVKVEQYKALLDAAISAENAAE